jgi:hypothetical protein
MKTIDIPDDDLKRLERRFGPDVRHMGAWNSDGVFGYSSVSLGAVEAAVEGACKPGLLEAVSRLRNAREPVAAFLALVEAFGPEFIAGIRAAHSATSRVTVSGRPAVSAKPASARAATAA